MRTAPNFSAIRVSCRCRSRGLTSKRYADRTARRRSTRSARGPRSEIRAGNPAAHEGDNTTHYSVVDRDGNAVANTYTLNFSYGLGLVADGTGILLNNELDDFAAKAGVPNAYGLVGGDANAPGPGKRPLSSMSPTIVLRDGTRVPGHRHAGRQPHHHDGAAGDPQRGRSPDEHRRRGRGAAHPSSVAAGSGVCRARLLARHAAPARSNAATRSLPRRPPARRTRSSSTPDGLTGAADPRQRGTLAEGY